MSETRFVSAAELQFQRACMRRARELAGDRRAVVDTYGCQQNEADSERMRGMLLEMGYTLTEDETADLIVINTCAVREHAEERIYGVLGRLTHTKRQNPGQRIILVGCMAGLPHVRQRLRASYRLVDAVIETTSFWRLPEVLLGLLEGGGDYSCPERPDSRIAEGLPVERKLSHRAWVSVMYGCTNFCSYCIVPYVRGPERSRRSADILREVEEVVAAGAKEITLLGQNVNSYGNDASDQPDFPALLERVAAIPGDFLVRFMTSHPKDATKRMIDVMASSDKIEPHLHLPVQSGSNRILTAMNRGYTRDAYLELIAYAKKVAPGMAFTSDIIVGFPGETERDLEDTLSLIRAVEYDALFTFLYSKRAGTPAAELFDDTPEEEKKARFLRLLEVQNEISRRKHDAAVGTEQRVLIEGLGRGGPRDLAARTEGGRPVNLPGDPALVGQWRRARITGATTWSLVGELTDK